MPDQKISQDTLITNLNPTDRIPVVSGGANRAMERNAFAAEIAEALGMSQVPFYVLEWNGTPQSVDCGNFWDEGAMDLGMFFWEAWFKPLPGHNTGLYIISEGWGGAHALLWSGMTGNVWNGTALTEFGSDDVPYISQWAHVAVGYSDGVIICYLDGVPVGQVAFAGPRRSSGSAGGGNNLYIGGSDHQNCIARIAQIRGFEGDNPMKAGSGGRNKSAFVPSTVFGSQWFWGASMPQANFLIQGYVPQQIIADESQGYPPGRRHSGRIRGTGHGMGSNYTSDRSNYPAPQFVLDPGAPQALTLTAPVQPAGKTYSPTAPPSGSLIFDSFERKNSTYTWEGVGGLGSTESGTLGPKVWTHKAMTDVVTKSFGILNEKAVFLSNESACLAWVEAGSANLDISVNRHSPRTWGMGRSTSILFRYVDDNNYCVAFTQANGAVNEYLIIRKVVAGASADIRVSTTDIVSTTWVTFRIITKTDGTITAFADATQVYTTTDAQHASATKCGLFVHNVSGGSGLDYRWKNFTVKVAA